MPNLSLPASMTATILNDPTTNPISSLQELGVELVATDSSDGRHIAVVFRVDEKDQPMLCHLRWHHWLAHEPSSGKSPWLQSQLGTSTRRTVAGLCKSVASRIEAGNPKVNFGFSVDLKCFNKDGRYLPQDDGKGLTCATFVLEIFARRTGIRLLDLQAWPTHRAGDDAWKQTILAELAKTENHLRQKGEHNAAAAVQRHIVGLKNNSDTPRYRPEEVAAGTQYTPTPMPYKKAEEEGGKILEELCFNYRPPL